MFNRQQAEKGFKFSRAEQRGVILLLALLLFASLATKVAKQSSPNQDLSNLDTIYQHETLPDTTIHPITPTEQNRWLWQNWNWH